MWMIKSWLLRFFSFALAAGLIAIQPAPANANQDVRMARNRLQLQLFAGDGQNFMLVNPLEYDIISTGRRIDVPAGFVTDFASVPWYARTLINVLGRHSIAAIVHDYLYWEQRCTRDEADAILREAMGEYESSSFDINAVYYAVSFGAKGAWEQNATDKRKGLVKVLREPYRSPPINIDWESYRQKLFKEHAEEDKVEPGTPDYCKLKPK